MESMTIATTFIYYFISINIVSRETVYAKHQSCALDYVRKQLLSIWLIFNLISVVHCRKALAKNMMVLVIALWRGSREIWMKLVSLIFWLCHVRTVQLGCNMIAIHTINIILTIVTYCRLWVWKKCIQKKHCLQEIDLFFHFIDSFSSLLGVKKTSHIMTQSSLVWQNHNWYKKDKHKKLTDYESESQTTHYGYCYQNGQVRIIYKTLFMIS